MSSRVIFAAVAAELSICVVAMTGCASGDSGKGFGGAPSHSTHPTATPAGTYAASASVTKQYGITEWRSYFGPNEIVLTGYRSDGTAARGAQFAWFAPSQGSVGHTRLTMLDGSGAVLRRMVGGGEAGHLSNEQIALIQTMRSDVAMGRKPAVHKLAEPSSGRHLSLHLQDGSGGSIYGNGPGQGPQCFEASTDPSTVIDASGCIVGAFTFETVVGGLMAMGSCAQWAVDNAKTSTTCNAENSQYCNNDTPPTCNYGQDSSTNPPPAPQAQCDQACICANYGVYNGMPCSTTCVDNSACSSGQECHWGSCGPERFPHQSERLAAESGVVLHQRQRDDRSDDGPGRVLERQRPGKLGRILGRRQQQQLVRDGHDRWRSGDGQQRRRVDLERKRRQRRRPVRGRWRVLRAGLGLLSRRVQLGHVRRERRQQQLVGGRQRQ
jgi:hypothetical protein